MRTRKESEETNSDDCSGQDTGQKTEMRLLVLAMRWKFRVKVFPVMKTQAHAGSVRDRVQPRAIRVGAGVPGPQAPVRVLRGRVRGGRTSILPPPA